MTHDPAILGKSVTLNAKPFTVVGVMPPGFVYPDGADGAVWLPDAVLPAATVPGRNPQSVGLIGKLKPGVSVEQARAELDRSPIAVRLDLVYLSRHWETRLQSGAGRVQHAAVFEWRSNATPGDFRASAWR